MTWHSLAESPLPEPKHGQVLLIRAPRQRFAMQHVATLETTAWYADDGEMLSPDALRREWLKFSPNAQWFIVPSPEEQDDSDADR